MRGINKLLTFIAVTLCFFVGASLDRPSLIGLSFVIAVTAFILESYDLPNKIRRRSRY